MFGSSQAFGASQGVMGGPEVKKPRQEEKMTALPVTIRQAELAMSKTSDEGDIRFHGIEAGMLLVVGVVESVSQQAGSLELVLNDSTGRIRVRYYEMESDKQIVGIEVGRYVFVAGQLRMTPAQHISATTLRTVQCADEVSYHMIEAAHAAVKLQKGVSEPATMKMQLSQDSPMKPVATPVARPVAAAAPATSPTHKDPQSADLKGAVVKFLKEKGEGVEAGLSLVEICGHLKPSPELEVRKALEELVSDGDVFNTIDDDHFSCI
jgi:biotin carboxyl carrier protein